VGILVASEWLSTVGVVQQLLQESPKIGLQFIEIVNIPELVQWAKKLIHRRSNFACKSNYGPRNKGKSVGNSGHKGRYRVLCYTRVQNFSLIQSFNIQFTIKQTWWISFFAGTWFGPFWPLSLPLSFWACSQSHFYKPHLVFYPIPPALAPKAHPHQQEGPIDIGLPLEVLPPIFKWAEAGWLQATSWQCPWSIRTILKPSWRCL